MMRWRRRRLARQRRKARVLAALLARQERQRTEENACRPDAYVPYDHWTLWA